MTRLPLLLLQFALASATSSCDLKNAGNYRFLTCSEFESSADLKENVERESPSLEFTLVLSHSHLDRILPDTLPRVPASVLEFDNVTVESFCQDDATLFPGLKDTLTSLAFSRNSTLPCRWGVLRDLDRLQHISFSDMTLLNLSSDFNELPHSLKVLSIVHSTVSNVDANWLSSLPNLEIVSIRNANLKVFLRSMIVKPAPYLRRLDLFNNSLTSLDKDFCQGYPALKYLTLSNNQITTFEEETFAPLLPSGSNVQVRLIGNPLHCDCRIRFMKSYPSSWLRAVSCAEPLEYRHRSLNNLAESQLQCGGSV